MEGHGGNDCFLTLSFNTLPVPGAIVRMVEVGSITTIQSKSRISPPNLTQPFCRDKALSSSYLMF